MSLDFSKFVKEILTPLSFSTNEKAFLKQLRFSGGTYKDFASVLATVPECEDSLIRATKTLFEGRLKEPVTSAAVALSMLGFLPARNFMAASLLKIGGTNLVPSGPEVAKALRFSLEGESIGEAYATDFFLGGYVFDAIASILVPDPKATKAKDGDPSLNKIWKHSILVAKNACKLSSTFLPSAALERDLTMDGLLHDVGKIAFSQLNRETEEELSKKPLPTEMRWLGEETSHSNTHDALGYLLLSRLGFAEESSWVSLFHHQPYLAEKKGGAIYVRSILVWLADHALRNREIFRNQGVPERLLNNWLKIAGPALGCKEKEFKDAVNAIQV